MTKTRLMHSIVTAGAGLLLAAGNAWAGAADLELFSSSGNVAPNIMILLDTSGSMDNPACGTCEIMCPIGAIELYEEIPHVCDLCGGDPRCVRACTLDAIRYEPDGNEAVSLKEFKKGSRGLGPEEKRLRYVMICSEQLRQNWIAERRG